MSDVEKRDVFQDEHIRPHGSDASAEARWDAAISRFTPEQQRNIIRRIDVRLVLTLGLMYTVSLMDRTNTGLAAVSGMFVDMQLFIEERYSVIVLVFFITYVLLQPPATVVLRKFGPKIFLPTITLLWGCVLIGMGFVTDWTHLAVTRLLLGVFEAGFFPGAAYLLSCWYPRYELQKRNAVFYLIGSLASAFSGILCYGFVQAEGVGGNLGLGRHVITPDQPIYPFHVNSGIAGWRWIFIFQGLLTVIIAFFAYLFIVDFPELAYNNRFFNFLTREESDFVVARIEKDRKDVDLAPFSVKSYLAAGLDLKVWGFAVLFGLTTTVTYAIAYFLPIILQQGMGFTDAAAQCLLAPPYVMAAIVMFAVAWAGDKYHIRSPFILINACLMLVGLGLLGFVTNVGARYFGVFLATSGANANIPCILTWQANNIRGQWKRALCSATLVGFGGIGGIIGSTVFRQQDSPIYRPGIYTTMIAAGLTIIVTLALVFKFDRANKRAAAGGKIIEALDGFRYTL